MVTTSSETIIQKKSIYLLVNAIVPFLDPNKALYTNIKKAVVKRVADLKKFLPLGNVPTRYPDISNLETTNENIYSKLELMGLMCHRVLFQSMEMRQEMAAYESEDLSAKKRPHLFRRLAKSLLWAERINEYVLSIDTMTDLTLANDEREFLVLESQTLKQSIQAISKIERQDFESGMEFLITAIKNLHALTIRTPDPQLKAIIYRRILFLAPFTNLCAYNLEAPNPFTEPEFEQLREDLFSLCSLGGSKSGGGDFLPFEILSCQQTKRFSQFKMSKTCDVGKGENRRSSKKVVEEKGFCFSSECLEEQLFIEFLEEKDRLIKDNSKYLFIENLKNREAKFESLLCIFMSVINSFEEFDWKDNSNDFEEYFEYRKGNILLLRNFLLAEKMRFDYSQQKENKSQENEISSKDKKVYAHDVVLMYEKIIKGLTSLAQRFTDDPKEERIPLIEYLTFCVSYFSIFRDYYIAQCYENIGKLAESQCCLGYLIDSFDEIEYSIHNFSEDFYVTAKSRRALKKQAIRSYAEVCSQRIFEANKKTRKFHLSRGELFVDENPRHLNSSLIPNFQLLPPKPIFFDIAYDYIRAPRVKQKPRLEEQNIRKTSKKSQNRNKVPKIAKKALAKQKRLAKKARRRQRESRKR